MPAVVCRPYYIPQSDPFCVYPATAAAAHTQVLLPCGFKRRQRSDLIEERRENKNLREYREHYNPAPVDELDMIDRKTTLELFPLRRSMENNEEESVGSVDPSSSFVEARESTSSEENKHQPFFDFFTSNSYHD